MLGRGDLVLLAVGPRRDGHGGERNRAVQPQRIAVELELTPELREFRAEAADVARSAIASRLLSERRNRLCGPMDRQRRAEQEQTWNKSPARGHAKPLHRCLPRFVAMLSS